MAKHSNLEVESVIPSVADVEIPPKCYVDKRVNIPCLSPKQAMYLKRLTVLLSNQGARLDNGRLVISGSNAVRYILENLANQDS